MKKKLTLLLTMLLISTVFTTVTANIHEYYCLKEDIYQDNVFLPKQNDKYPNTYIEDISHAYHHLDLSEFKTGILLDLGAILYDDIITQYDGTAKRINNPLSTSDFFTIYSAFEHSSLTKQLPSSSQIKLLSQTIRETNYKTPLALSFITYDRIDPQAYIDGRLLFETDYIKKTNEKTSIGLINTFIASTVLAPKVYGPDAEFILPSSFILSNNDQIITLEKLTIHFINQRISLPINLDEPFSLPALKGDDHNTVPYIITGLANGQRFYTHASFEYTQLQIPTYYDLPAVTASIPYLGIYGEVNIRIYPSTGIVTGTAGNYQPKLRNVMVIVDGFDVLNDRTQETIWEDFGSGMQQFLDMGFDIISIDYVDGNTYIQRNGLAIREVLQRIPEWMESGYEDHHGVLVAGSMGTQTARYAMRTAELDSENHHIGLFIALDGPFRGANIPIGIQALVTLFGTSLGKVLSITLPPLSNDAKDLLEGLNSPAASQMLFINRHDKQWYVPKPTYYSYYTVADALGLPQNTRNIAVASGNGYGLRLSDKEFENFGKVSDSLSVPFSWISRVKFEIDINTTSDRADVVFDGAVGLKIQISTIFGWKTLINLNKKLDVALEDALYIDLAAGGYRTSVKQMCDQFNDGINLLAIINKILGTNLNWNIHLKTMTRSLDMHNFIPTFSALGIETDDVNYAPGNDADLYNKTPFDAVFFESGPNAEHVEETPGMIEFVKAELQQYLDKQRIVHVGDFNGNGYDDLLYQNKNPGGKTYIVYSNANTVFSAPVDITDSYGMSSNLWADHYRQLHVGDFNGDGRADILLQNRRSMYHASYVLFGREDGTFSNKYSVSDKFGMTRGMWAADDQILHVGDFNGDGLDDILLQNKERGGKTYFLQARQTSSSNYFYDVVDITNNFWMSSNLWADYHRMLHVGDFNGDGRADILLQNRRSMYHSSYVLFGQSDGSFTNAYSISDKFGMTRGMWAADDQILHVGDFNGDGLDDILLQNKATTGNTYLLLAQQTDYTNYFEDVVDITTLHSLSSSKWADYHRMLHVGDFNGDGRADILLQNRKSKHHASYMLFATSDGSFTPETVVSNRFGMTTQQWARENRRIYIGEFNSRYGSNRNDIVLIGHHSQISPILLQGVAIWPIDYVKTPVSHLQAI